MYVRMKASAIYVLSFERLNFLYRTYHRARIENKVGKIFEKIKKKKNIVKRKPVKIYNVRNHNRKRQAA